MLPTLRDGAVSLRPLRPGDAERLAAIVAMDGVREWWAGDAGAAETAAGLENEGRAFVVEEDGELAGWLGFDEELDPDYRHASMDIVLAPAHQDHGVGRTALRLCARWLLEERGHHRLTIDPARENARAIHVYESIGFKPVGVLRDYERAPDGRWRDGVLMDLLAGELRAADAR